MNRRLWLVALGTLVLLVVAWYFALWTPQSSDLSAARSNAELSLTSQGQLSSRLGGLRSLQRQLPAEAASLEQSLVALPTTVSIDTIIDQISAAAESSGVSWTNESQSVGSSGSSSSTNGSSGVAPISLVLSATGTYQQATDFVTSLQHLPRLLVINSLAFAPSGDSVSLSINAQAFYDPSALPNLAGEITQTASGVDGEG